MTHQFDVDVAKEYGVNAAILFQNIAFWCAKNEANNHNFFDGSYWTYNSRSAFAKLFPYFSERQIKTALDKLIDGGVIKTGCYNNDSFDKSLWYALTKKGLSIIRKCQIDYAEMSDRYDGNVRPIPDINPDIKTADNKPDNSIVRFDDFWSVYPHKVKKNDALKAWRSGKLDKIAERIIADVKLRCETEWKGQDIHFVPHPTTYLHQKRWEDDTRPTVRKDSAEPEPRVYKDADYENDW